MGFSRSHTAMITAIAVVAVGSMAAAAGLWVFQDSATAGGEAEAAAKTQSAPRNLGPSGLPIPRFVSLKRDKVNVRKGPSTSHKVAWVFTSKGYPVEIIAESDHWRRVRDSEGEEGWVYHSLLSGWRTGVVSPWREGSQTALLADPTSGAATVAKLESGVLGRIERCTGKWCNVQVNDFNGWIKQDALWGVYPGEQIE
ncbi:MAG: SH3 domain-containing protein [Pseudomonadota bacterium]